MADLGDALRRAGVNVPPDEKPEPADEPVTIDGVPVGRDGINAAKRPGRAASGRKRPRGGSREGSKDAHPAGAPGGAAGGGEAPARATAPVPARTCECGEQFTPHEARHRLCPKCAGRYARAGGDRAAVAREVRLPEAAVLSSFHDDAGRIRKEVYVDGARAAAGCLGGAGVTAGALRHVYAALKGIELRLTGPAPEPFDAVRAGVFRLLPLVEMHANHGGVPGCCAEFVRRHLDLAARDERSFRGFVEYVTSVLCYLKQK